MKTRLGSFARTSLAILGVATLALGAAVVGACADKPAGPEPTSSASASTSADAMANFGGKVGKALRAAPSALSSGSAQVGGEPPPQGMFGPGEADKIVKKGAPQVSVFDEGTGPKVNISSYVLAGDWQVPVALQVSSQGRSIGVPAMGMLLHVRPLKPGEEAPKPAAPAPATSSSASAKPSAKAPPAPKPPASGAPSAGKPVGSAAPSGSAQAEPPPGPPPVAPATDQGVRMVVTVSDARVQADAAAVPPQDAQLAASFNGSQIVYTLDRTGASAFQNILASGANPRLHLLLTAIDEVLSAEYVPAPGKPLGVGGYFMVVDRGTSMGIDVVRYRVFKVVKITGDVATVTLEVRQYAAESKLNGSALGDEDKDIPLSAYGAASKGILDVAPNATYPVGTFLQFQTQIAMGENVAAIEFLAQMGPLPAGVQITAGGGGGDEE